MSRIERIEGFVLTAPIDPPRAFSAGLQTSFDHIVVRLTDSDGVRGYGECVPIPGARGMLEALGVSFGPSDQAARQQALRRQPQEVDPAGK